MLNALHNKRLAKGVLAKIRTKGAVATFWSLAQTAPGRAHSPKTRCQYVPLLAPNRRRHLPNGKIKQSLRHPMTREVEVNFRLAEDLKNLIDGCPHPRPALNQSSPPHGIRNIRRRGDPIELGAKSPKAKGTGVPRNSAPG